MSAPAYDVVVPTVGRPSLGRLLAALGAGRGPAPGRIVIVDDRPGGGAPLDAPAAGPLGGRVTVVRGRAAGPAAARNLGWRLCDAPWIAFLDDDVVPPPDWRAALAADLGAAAGDLGGSQGRVEVPLPAGRRPTDAERGVAGLAGARWATADMAYRRAALAAVGGFDERFGRAYREDADLALRVEAAGWRLARGERRVVHPVVAGTRAGSLRAQRGNADDMLMRRLHGPGWRERAGAPPGRRPRHLAVTAAGALALAAALSGRRRAAGLAAAGWLAGTAEFAWARIAPGPRTRAELATMAATSALIPPLATWHTARGVRRARRLAGDRLRAPAPAAPAAAPPRAVLLDRDGTLIVDVPYNGDPDRVRPMPAAREALERLRRAGIPTAVVSNQSGIARGILTDHQVRAVNRRVDDVLGPVGPWLFCPHGPGDGCGCRKPQPGLVRRAAAALGVAPEDCAVLGDIGADVEAARRAGARAILVPTPRTRREEVLAAPEVAPDLVAAVERLLGAPA